MYFLSVTSMKLHDDIAEEMEDETVHSVLKCLPGAHLLFSN